jgi:hypothetical protein
MLTSKSPNKVAQVAYASAKLAFPSYSHTKSPHKFTQPQLVACLALKEFFKKDYRGLTAILEDSSDLQKILELTEIPHYTTLQKAAHRLFKKDGFKKLLLAILDFARKGKILRKSIQLAALDSTGFESRHTSSYFIKRRDRDKQKPYQTTTYARFPKLGILTDTANHLILQALTKRGPMPDVSELKPAIKEAAGYLKVNTLVADAGYDSESNHVFARVEHGIRTIIPARIGRPTGKKPAGYFRRLMTTAHFNRKLYGQRWQGETVNSMLKRNLNSFLRAKTYWSQCRELCLKVFTHNVMIVWRA